MEDEHESTASGLVDADQFLRFSESLKQGFARLGRVGRGDAAHERWQRRLLAITNVAKHDLDRAESQYERFREDFDREFGAPDDAPGDVATD